MTPLAKGFLKVHIYKSPIVRYNTKKYLQLIYKKWYGRWDKKINHFFKRNMAWLQALRYGGVLLLST